MIDILNRLFEQLITLLWTVLILTLLILIVSIVILAILLIIRAYIGIKNSTLSPNLALVSLG